MTIKSGIDISLNDKASKTAYFYAKKSFKNLKNINQTTNDYDFSGGFKAFGNDISIASDGIGTKIEIAERLNKYDTLGYDLLAMVCDDLISNFYTPVFVSNILDVDFIDLNIIDELMKGLYNASKQAEIIISGGEIAELGNRISGYGPNMHFNWGATAIGFKNNDNKLKEKIKEGDFVYALKSQGFRSNGFSLARKILEENYGKYWHEEKYENNLTWGEILLRPSKIYTPLIKKLLKKYNIKKIAHITGGGFKNNTARILPKDLSIEINTPLKTPSHFKKLIQIGKISKEQATLTWNMGYGIILITPEEINKNSIDWPIVKIGKTVKSR